MNEWIFSKTKICKSRFKSWIRLSELNFIILSDYAKKKKKKDLKRAAGVDISNFRKDWFS